MDTVLRILVSLLLSLLANLPSPVLAAEEPSNPYETARLSRLSLIDGEVLLQRGDEEEWVAASINVPLRPHDKLWSTDGARAEIQFDNGTIVRLAENTNLDLLSLKPGWTHLQLTLGVASFMARSFSHKGEQEPFFEIDTPQATLQATRSATFRIDVAEDGSTEITVREGDVELDRDEGRPLIIARNQRVVIEGGDSPLYLLESAQEHEQDEWDRWNEDRDAQLAQAGSREYFSADVVMGVMELDLYGRWDHLSPYGNVWIPRVAADWAPYRVGRWVWMEPWGWTWVSYEPWGWIPYHYGRWVIAASVGWVWVPDPVRQVWTPGCVRFIYGPDWVAWVPLAPGEVYYYKPRVSVHVEVNLINYRAPGALVVVPRQTFVTGEPGKRRFNPPRDPIRTGRVAIGPPPVVPSRASLHPVPQKVVRPDLLPPRLIQRPVVYSRRPSTPPPLFERRVKEIHNAITQGRPPAVAVPPLQERSPSRTEERRFSVETIHKDVTVRKVIRHPSSSSTTQKQMQPPIEEPPRPIPEGKREQPPRSRRFEVGRTPPVPSAPNLSGEQAQEAQPLYRVPPRPEHKKRNISPDKGGQSGAPSGNR